MMRFKKVKWDKKEVTLEWTTSDGTETHTHSLTSKQRPHKDLNEALQALRGDVVTVTELDIAMEELRVQSVSFSFSEKTGVRGAVVTALKPVSIASSPVVLNTPHLTESGESERGVMPPSMWKRVLWVESEASDYLSGKRAPKEQLDMTDAMEPEDDLKLTMRFGDGEAVETTLGGMRRATEHMEALNAAGRDV